MSKPSRSYRICLFSAASVIAVSAYVPAAAQAAEADQAVGEIVVTGSRLTSGFQTPTPVTVVTQDQLNATGAPSIAQSLAQLPVFKGSTVSAQPSGGSPNSSNGQALLNMRGLGSQRNLVLLNGQRVIATNAGGSVDINVLPLALVRSVEVVTGGASSAYGSDAVSGVVNFILDTRFVGLKADAQTGVSTYGDANSYKLSLTWGGQFAGDRLHVTASAEGFVQNSVNYYTAGGREWATEAPAGLVPNATVGAQPRNLILANVRSSNASYGGLITAGPLRGTEFLPGGATRMHDYGSYLSGVWQVGGNGIVTHQPYSPRQQRISGFFHADYDVTESLNVNVEALYGWTNNRAQVYPNYQFGQFGMTIFNDNAYLPAAVRTAMAANNITSFAMGRFMVDQHLQEVDPFQKLQRYSIGAEQRLGGDWLLSAYYAHNISNQDTHVNHITNLRKFYASVDAVVNPANGQIVCRSTLSGLDAGCVPMNPFGQGSVSQATSDYVLGSSIRWLTLKEDVVDASISGTLPESLSLGAGPISAAAGVTYRHEGSSQTSDAVSQATTSFTGLRGAPAALNNRPGGYQTFNPVPLSGSYSVKEAFAELGVPLLKDRTLAQSLDVNLAARVADYSNSGAVWSWKAGATWEPTTDLRLRLTKSKDVRAPNINELFNPRSTNAANVVYNGVTTGYTGFTVGNPNLDPEVAHTDTAGIVYSPGFVPGLSMSVDGFKIDIDGAIGQLGAQSIVDQCARGSQDLCALIVSNGPALIITNPSLNLSAISVRGLDFEGAYRTSFAGGGLSLRLLATYLDRFTSQSRGGQPVNNIDANSSRVPWSATLQATWDSGPFSATVQERYVGSTKYNGLFVEGIDINNNTVKAQYYTDLTIRFKLRQDIELFGAAVNVFNRDPPAAPAASTFQQPTNPALYDTMGRYFSIGVHYRP